VDELVTPSQLKEILPRTDWLALASPLTEETRHVIDAEAIALMPRGSHILNIARGEVVDEAAMIDGLRTGQLAGAYLDVFEVEPLPGESPLWSMPNVIVTPHNSSISKGNDRRAADFFFRNLAAWAKDEAMINEVP
jgi:phosphoglycerate dehydrogenase-like enzyme